MNIIRLEEFPFEVWYLNLALETESVGKFWGPRLTLSSTHTGLKVLIEIDQRASEQKQVFSL